MGRKILLGIAGSALVFFLITTATDTSIVRVVGSPEPLKKILNDSGVYNSVVPSMLNDAKQISGDNGKISLKDPAVQAAAVSTFNGTYLRSTTDNVLDSVYRWLDGETTLPDFKLDLTAKKIEFANKVAVVVKQRAAALPSCKINQIPAEFNALSASCLPPGVSPNKAAATVRKDILNGKGFLDHPVITAKTLKSDGSTKSVFSDQLRQVPDAYSKFKSTPWILATLTLVTALAVIFLSSTRLKGLRHAGFVMIGSGLFLVLVSLAVNKAVDNKLLPKISLTNNVLQEDVRKLAHDSVHAINGTYLLFGVGYVALGALAVGGYYFLSRRELPAETPSQPAKSDVKPETQTPSPASTKPKTRKKIEVK